MLPMILRDRRRAGARRLTLALLLAALAASWLVAPARAQETAQPPVAVAPAPPPQPPPPPPTGPFGIIWAKQLAPELLVSGQPTTEQLAAVAAAGYKTVIDLRPASEERGFDEPARLAELGLTYLNLPVTLESLDAGTIERFRAAFASAERPLYLHCSSSNRVGALYFSHLVLDEGMSADAALEQAHAAGLKAPPLEEKIKALVAAAQLPAAN